MPMPSFLQTQPAHEKSSDDALCKVLHRLETSPYLALRLVRCSCQGSRLILHGRVPSYYLKQLAQVVAGQCLGMRTIDNRLEVA